MLARYCYTFACQKFRDSLNIEKIYGLIQQKLAIWLRELVRMLPNIALAALILVLGLLLARLIKKLAIRFITKVSHHPTIIKLFINFVHLVIVGVVIFATLSVLKLDKAVTSILAGAGILGLALAFAFQDIAANFISGIFITLRRPLRIGDIIKTKDYMGKVHEINLRDTVVATFQGQMVIIPNKEIYQNPIENFSLLGKRRIDLECGVSYGDDLEKVQQVVIDAVQKVSVRTEDEVTFFFKEFGDSSINFVVRIWVNSPEQPVYLQGLSEAVMAIKKAFDANNIMIPFPIRTLDFGIKGGEKLSEMAIKLQKDEQAG